MICSYSSINQIITKDKVRQLAVMDEAQLALTQIQHLSVTALHEKVL